MKKFNKCKILVSTLLICLIFLPNVSAYYTGWMLKSNPCSYTLRYPIYEGNSVDFEIGSNNEALYLHKYSTFLGEISETADKQQTPMQIYTQELKHICACAYAVSQLLGYADDQSRKFAADVENLCNSQVYNREIPPEKSVIFAVNYIYSFLGYLVKTGIPENMRTRDLFKFSELAYTYACGFCRGINEEVLPRISAEEFRRYIPVINRNPSQE